MTDERHRLARLVDLAGELQQTRRAAHDVGRIAARNHQPVEIPGLDLIYAGVHGERVPPLTLVGALAGAGDDGPRSLLLEADLGIPELEVLVERTGEEQDGRVGQGHGTARPSCGKAQSERETA